ncbi:CUB domain-containing protein [Trichostrongylus colubriformis]|uniref:CUB domain-containing protein n=1 Tax=Trichostrongylus colubriformis TaxID=6319 RepID=A0AAN8EVT1_TRICO
MFISVFLQPRGCGKIIRASSNWTKLVDVMGVRLQTSLEFKKCHYWIESPPGTEIEVKLLNFTEGLSTDGCSYAGVEIKTNKDQTLTGYRFCSPEAAGKTLRSHINRVPIMTYNRKYETTTTIEYRFVPASRNESQPTLETTRHNKSDIHENERMNRHSSSPRPSSSTTARPFSKGSEDHSNTKPTASAAVESSTSSCQDTSIFCRFFKDTGMCNDEASKDSVRKDCPKSCGLC